MNKKRIKRTSPSKVVIKHKTRKINELNLKNKLKGEKIFELQERIDKAIELLEKGIFFCKNDSQGVYDKCNIAINREKKVLEVLRGDSNE